MSNDLKHEHSNLRTTPISNQLHHRDEELLSMFPLIEGDGFFGNVKRCNKVGFDDFGACRGLGLLDAPLKDVQRA
jgi:hypothetical protein